MSRNHKLELENIGPRKWRTIDGRFGIVQVLKPINPFEVTEKQSRKIQYIYAIKNLQNFNLPGNFYELAPEVGRVERFADIFPWLGEYTGEGSFDTKNISRIVPKGTKESGRITEIKKIRAKML